MTLLDSTPDSKQTRALKLFLIATLAVGAAASLLGRPLPVAIASWAIAPWSIGPLWTLTYGLMAVAAWLAWKKAGLRSAPLIVFAIQLGLNLAWRIWPAALLGWAMDLAMVITLILFGLRNLMAALTFLPCTFWCLFISLPMNGLWRPS
jgi:benzodiazapine receptor